MLFLLLLTTAGLATELTVQAVGDPLVVYVDGVEVATTPLEGRELAAGQHRISAKNRQSAVQRLEAEFTVSGEGQALVEFDWQAGTARAFLTKDASAEGRSGSDAYALVRVQPVIPGAQVQLLPSSGAGIALGAAPTIAPAGAYRCVVRTQLGQTEWPLTLAGGSYELVDAQPWLPSRLRIDRFPEGSTLDLQAGRRVVWTGGPGGFMGAPDPVVGIASASATIQDLPAGSYAVSVRSDILGAWEESLLVAPGVDLTHALDWASAEHYSTLALAYADHRALVESSGVQGARNRAGLTTLGTSALVAATAVLVARSLSLSAEARTATSRYEADLESGATADAIEAYELAADTRRSARWSWVGAGAAAVPAGFGVWMTFEGWGKVRRALPAVPGWDPYAVIHGDGPAPRTERPSGETEPATFE